MPGFAEYADYDGMGLAELVSSGQVSPLELVEEAISRIEAHNGTLNAVVYKMYEAARTAAGRDIPVGPFRGVPFLIKDLAALYAGVPYTAGSRFLQNFVPNYDSELVSRYKKAGLIILGKTNTPEFGLTPYTESRHLKPAHNPWDTSRTPGGSSGGSGASVAARFVPMANGGDGGGSIRIPASCNGIFGFKPTRGRIPTGPVIGEAWQGFAIEHVLTRSVRDSAAMLDATGGADAGAPYITPDPLRPFLSEVSTEPGKLRIAVTTKPFMGKRVDEDCKAAVTETVKLLQDLGHEVVDDAPDFDGEQMALDFVTMLVGEVSADITQLGALTGRKPTRADFEPTTWTLHKIGKATSATKFSLAVRNLQMAARKIGRFFDKYDILLTPTLSRPPFKIGEIQPSAAELKLMDVVGRLNAERLLEKAGIVKTLAGKSFDFIPYTPVFNVTGQPAMSVPLYWNKAGLPVGVHFVGRFAEDATLFQLAGQLERARPWANKVPPLVQGSKAVGSQLSAIS
jgi:amidase